MTRAGFELRTSSTPDGRVKHLAIQAVDLWAFSTLGILHQSQRDILVREIRVCINRYEQSYSTLSESDPDVQPEQQVVDWNTQIVLRDAYRGHCRTGSLSQTEGGRERVDEVQREREGKRER